MRYLKILSCERILHVLIVLFLNAHLPFCNKRIVTKNKHTFQVIVYYQELRFLISSWFWLFFWMQVSLSFVYLAIYTGIFCYLRKRYFHKFPSYKFSNCSSFTCILPKKNDKWFGLFLEMFELFGFNCVKIKPTQI